MSDQACRTLADLLAEKRANGLVDIKFYVRKTNGVSPSKLCEEAAALMSAVKSGVAVEPFKFDDSKAVTAAG